MPIKITTTGYRKRSFTVKPFKGSNLITQDISSVYNHSKAIFLKAILSVNATYGQVSEKVLYDNNNSESRSKVIL